MISPEQIYIDEVCEKFWSMYPSEIFKPVDCFHEKDLFILVFHNKCKRRLVKVYMKNGILRPFFEQKGDENAEKND
jgi:hypothetical protein